MTSATKKGGTDVKINEITEQKLKWQKMSITIFRATQAKKFL